MRSLLLGNRAIVYGAMEAGVEVATTYPGTPSSEIGDTFARCKLYMEYSTNEKVALEVAAAASFSDHRSIVAMKHVGLNVASDPLMTLAYTGIRSGMVIVVAGDPSMHSSQNEQDSRLYGVLGNLPVLEPATPQECHDMARHAFDLSEELGLPVLLVTTTRVSHTSGPVDHEEIAIEGEEKLIKKEFKKDPQRFVTVPKNSIKLRLKLIDRVERARQLACSSELNYVYDTGLPSDIGVVTSGHPSTYVREILGELGADVKVLKLGFTHPFPDDVFGRFSDGLQKILVVEELEPYLETMAKKIAQERGLLVEIAGKSAIPRHYEVGPDQIIGALSELMGTIHQDKIDSVGVKTPPLPVRSPVFCPGCGHRSVYYAVRRVFPRAKTVFSSDIGCYTLGVREPYLTADTCICMGSSIGMACGFSSFTDERVIAFIGDSTFFHSGIPALVNAVHNSHPFITIVLDNSTTAMTGHQPNPGMGQDERGDPAPAVSIKDVAEACGVGLVREVDAGDLGAMVEVLKEVRGFHGSSLIVAKYPCILLQLKEKRERGERPKIYGVTDLCDGCYLCTDRFACPALVKDGGCVTIDRQLCTGCGVCAQVCPKNAIVEVDCDL